MGIRHDVPAVRATAASQSHPTTNEPPPPPPPDWDAFTNETDYRKIRKYYDTLTEAQKEYYFFNTEYSNNLAANKPTEDALSIFENIGNTVLHPIDTLNDNVPDLTKDAYEILAVVAVGGIIAIKLMNEIK